MRRTERNVEKRKERERKRREREERVVAASQRRIVTVLLLPHSNGSNAQGRWPENPLRKKPPDVRSIQTIRVGKK